MSDWGDFFKIQFELDDNKKQAQKDTERINSMINALEKKTNSSRYKTAKRKDSQRT